MKVVVVGALGLIGSSTVKCLASLGHEVVAIDSQVGSVWTHGWKKKAESLRLSLIEYHAEETHRFDPGVNQESLVRLLDRFSPHAIINVGGNSLASEFAARSSLVHETMTKLNHVLAVTAEQRSVRYVYISSSMVYGDFVTDPQPEDARLHPKDPYGALKAGCEYVVNAVGSQNPDFDFAILRPSAVYGHLDTNERVLVKVLHQLAEGEPVYIRDIKERLDFTYVDDLASMICRVSVDEGAIRDTFNVTNGQASTLEDALAAFQRILGMTISLAGAEPQDVSRPKRGSLSMSKFDARFGPHPMRSIDAGIASLVEDSQKEGLIDIEG